MFTRHQNRFWDRTTNHAHAFASKLSAGEWVDLRTSAAVPSSVLSRSLATVSLCTVWNLQGHENRQEGYEVTHTPYAMRAQYLQDSAGILLPFDSFSFIRPPVPDAHMLTMSVITSIRSAFVSSNDGRVGCVVRREGSWIGERCMSQKQLSRSFSAMLKVRLPSVISHVRTEKQERG